MKFVIVLLFFSMFLKADAIYDFWNSSQSTNNKNKIDVKNIKRDETYLNKNDTTKPNIANDLHERNIKNTSDFTKPPIEDVYLKYNDIRYKDKNTKRPTIANDLDPEKIKRSPDYIDILNKEEKNKKPTVINTTRKLQNNTNNKKPQDDTKLEEGFKSNTVVFYEEPKKRDETFIEIIPYATLGNNLFVIENGAYSARVLDDSISASMSIDLGLNYLWENRNIGYLWNINFSDYSFSEKDRTHPNSQSSGDINGYVISAMPTVFYELNKAQTMSVLVGYGAGFSYIQIDGDITLANNLDQTLSDTIKIDNFFFSHGLLLEVVHNNFMISFTKVNITLKEGDYDIDISENRLNLGYKFAF